ncbi:MAG: bifunctional adenosylcobinamide kinase/adenosylcobinamide-phosphate guanylyltransferase [Alphaproteobacteria bacterium]
MAGRAELSSQSLPTGEGVAVASRHVLVTGGQRSGKSGFAELLVEKSDLTPVYLATATAGDAAMRARIEAHRRRRSDRWVTVEEPLALAGALVREATAGRAVLVDCLTLWLTNLLGENRSLAEAGDALIDALQAATGTIVLVSGEVGAGIIPDNALARRFADDLGTLNQRVAATVGRVVLVSAGQPLLLKPSSNPEFSL